MDMRSAIEAVGPVGGIASVVALIFAIHYARRSTRKKDLVYETTSPTLLAGAVSPEAQYQIRVTFQRQGLPEERLDSVYVRFLRFANLGSEPIRREDIAPHNPLRVTIHGVRTLDVGLTAASRPVNHIRIGQQEFQMDLATVPVTFDFLDHRDGAVLKILTVTEKGEVVLDGDIIGMPHGIRMAGKAGRSTPRDKVTTAVAVLLDLGVLALPFFCFRWVTGAWTHAWLVALPFLALVLALVIILGMEALSLKREPLFPSSLEIPRWANLVSVLWPGDGFMSAREAHLRAESSEDEGQRRRNRQPRQSRTHS